MASLITLDLSDAKAAVMESRLAIVPKSNTRAYDAAQFTRLTEDWATWTTSADIDLWADIYRLRARARRESQNNPIARKGMKVFIKNIFGSDGIRLRMKIPMKKGKKLNQKLNELIEQLFKQWGRRDFCTVQGNMDWKRAQRFAGAQVWRDGECFIRRRTSANKFGFSLQWLDPDQLDTNYFMNTLPNGNQIRMGVEVSPDGRPIAYHFWDRHPAEWSMSNRNRIRIAAEDVIHLYDPERVMQTRGVSEMASSLMTMHMHGQYSMAEVVAARVAAAKMGFFEKAGTDAGFEGTERDEQRNIKVKMSPGTVEQLPEGVTFKPWDPQHPTNAFPAFTKMLLRLCGSGMDISYETLANDREGVNYSSIRAGLLDDRDTWRIWQDYFSTELTGRVFQWFLESAWLSGLVPLDGTSDDYVDYAIWTGRAWAWIDPLKDAQAATLMQSNGLETHTAQLAQQGDDFEETMETFAYEKEFKKQLGLVFGTDVHGVADTAEDDPAAGGSGGSTKKEGGGDGS